jgi:hypothetical protein
VMGPARRHVVVVAGIAFLLRHLLHHPLDLDGRRVL